ncbi:MAG: hypothetical protein P4L99_28825 [Chthoniobacter sp.]|nr:hypothetical protein [Chthoniobacter sp.]
MPTEDPTSKPLSGCAFLGWLLGVPLGFYVAYQLVMAWFAAAFPISPWFLGALVLWAILWTWSRNKENPWANAATGTLLSVWVGLIPAMLILMYYGNKTHADAKGAITDIEQQMLDAHKFLEGDWKWPLAFGMLGLLVLLTFASYFRPGWKLVPRFLQFQKGLSLATKALAVATAFTFFSKTDVVDPYAKSVKERLTVSLRESENKEADDLAHAVAVESLTKALQALPPAARGSYHRIFEVVERLDDKQVEPMLDDFVADRNAGEQHPETDSAKAQEAAPVDGREIPSEANIEVLLKAQKQRADSAEEKLKSAKENFSEVLSTTFGMANDKAHGKWVEPFANSLLKPFLGELTDTVTGFLSSLTEEALDHQLEEWKDRRAKEIAKLLAEKVDGKSDGVVELAKPEIAKISELKAEMEVLTSAPGKDLSGENGRKIRAVMEKLAGASDRLVLLSKQGGSVAAPGSHGTNPTGITGASLDTLVAEAQKQKASADTAIRSGNKKLVEHQKAREAMHLEFAHPEPLEIENREPVHPPAEHMHIP